MTSIYYPGSSSNPYYGTTNTTEPNMRQELINTLDGVLPEVAKGRYVLLRKMSQDANGNLIPCSCRSSLGEPDKDRWCPICWTEGNLWSEEWIKIYLTIEPPVDAAMAMLNRPLSQGLVGIPVVTMYAKYDKTITNVDKIIEVSLSLDGSVVSPVVRTSKYFISMAWPYRADNGKLEYYKIFTHKEDVKFLNPPTTP